MCPVEGCDSPYLSWHHFDPPWRERPHHEPAGMVALCLGHHKQADAGAFSPDQLRAMKQRGRQTTSDPVFGAFNWRREQLVVRAGGMTGVGCRVLLQFGDADAIWLSTDEHGNEVLNLDLFAADGSLVFSMRENDWVIHDDLDDVECRPSGRSLILRVGPRRIALALEFEALGPDELRDRLLKAALGAAEASARSLEEDARRAEQEGKLLFAASVRQAATGVEARAYEIADLLFEGVRRRSAAAEIACCEITGQFVFPTRVRLTSTSTIIGTNVITGSGAIAGDVVVRISESGTEIG